MVYFGFMRYFSISIENVQEKAAYQQVALIYA